MNDTIRPFSFTAPQQDLDDLRYRLSRTRWPDKENVDGWEQGVPLATIRRLVDYWRTEYDWRRCEKLINSFPQYVTEIDGVDIHFLHVRSSHEDALPIILTHGWPGSIIEFLKVIGPLVEPEAHGGDPADAFHVVIPSLPGYGFSGKPTKNGWGGENIATAWAELMGRLGYARYVAQGGDWGSLITLMMGEQAPEGLAAVHVNMLSIIPRELGEDLEPEEVKALAVRTGMVEGGELGYSAIQGTRPQTLAYSFADSPVGQAAWIYEKLRVWSGDGGDLETAFTIDEILDNITLYWLTNTGGSSARLYWESARKFGPRPVHVPLGYSEFPDDIIKATRKWADATFGKVIYWNEVDKGGHFAAWEQPSLFAQELRSCFRQLR